MNNKTVQNACYLYVDDDAPSRKVVELVLCKGAGVQNLALFSDSFNFRERLKNLLWHPDIILLDIHMRPQDGFELLQQIRAEPDYCHSKVVAVTASVMNEEVEKLRASGFDGAIGKPLNIDAFPALMARILAGDNVWYVW